MRRQRGIAEALLLYIIAGLVVAGLVAGAAGGLGMRYLAGKAKAAEEEAAQAREQLAAEKQSRAHFQAAAAECSAGVDALKAAAAKAEGQAAAAKAAAASAARQAEASAMAILAEHAAQGETACQFAKREADAAVDDRQAPPFKGGAP